MLYAPTWRPGSPGGSDAAAELAIAAGRHGWTLVYAAHPLGSPPPGVFAAPGFTTAELASVAAAFVTDYSSAVFEVALLGLPCYFYAPDLAQYGQDQGLYVDLAEAMPGPVLSDPEALAAAVAAGQASGEAARRFARGWVTLPAADPPPEPTACADRIAAIVHEMLDRPTPAEKRR
jgi:CDP-glycerol glycerophosphotransferase (TagB/SpsB family)